MTRRVIAFAKNVLATFYSLSTDLVTSIRVLLFLLIRSFDYRVYLAKN
jgi:hypothetical protein